MAHPSAGNRLSDLHVRILSGVVLGPVVLAAVWIGGPVFTVLVVVTALMIVREWVRLVTGGRGASLWHMLSYAFVVASLSVLLVAGPGAAVATAAGLGLALYGILHAAGVPNRLYIAFGIPYIGLAAIAVVWLRGHPETGMLMVFWLCFTVWSTDVGAFAAGRSIGGPKLAPAISPKKTWAGLIGGMVSAAAVGGVAAVAFGAAQPALAAAASAARALNTMNRAGDWR